MALFGAPLAHEDHAQRACRAALHLAPRLRDFAREVRAENGLEFAVRMGINSGEVVVGRIGDDMRMDYTAQGHTVGLAARLQERAAPGGILVGPRTADLVGGLFRLEGVGELRLKGISEPVRAWCLLGEGDLRTRLDVARARGLTGFVGRGDEMAVLDAALRRAQGGRGGAMGVVGAPGVGKSRLCEEFVQRCRARDVAVVEAHCLSHAREAPLGVLRDVLRGALGVDGEADPQTVRARVERRVVALDPALADALPLVNELLAIADDGSPEPEPDPVARERAIVGLLRRLLRARSEIGPLVVHLDDAHWIDARSARLLADAADVASTTRTLLLLNFRPEFHAEWTSRSYYQQLPVFPLGDDATRAMILSLLGDDESVVGLGEVIRERTQGNPFFIEEVVRALVASGALAGERGAYRRTDRTVEPSVPDTVQSLLAARVDGLDEREKLVLQSAAVIGKRFSRRVLGRIVDLSPDAVDASLAALERLEFVHTETGTDSSFRHPLTQEVAYASQLLERRLVVHAAVAATLEEVLADRLGECAALIAHHWEQARRPALASRWRRLAALRVTRIQPRRQRS